MCFRPAEATADVQPVTCTNCGETIFPTDGILPKFCPYCEELLEAAAATAPGAPAAPAAPGAPAAPNAPKPPAGA